MPKPKVCSWCMPQETIIRITIWRRIILINSLIARKLKPISRRIKRQLNQILHHLNLMRNMVEWECVLLMTEVQH
ncbi:hypothetical protein D3C72_1919720 [compost metagenome]